MNRPETNQVCRPETDRNFNPVTVLFFFHSSWQYKQHKSGNWDIHAFVSQSYHLSGVGSSLWLLSTGLARNKAADAAWWIICISLQLFWMTLAKIFTHASPKITYKIISLPCHHINAEAYIEMQKMINVNIEEGFVVFAMNGWERQEMTMKHW